MKRLACKDLTRPELDEILNSPGEKYEPFGLFICCDKIDETDVWTAVDNSAGAAITEEFGSHNSAVRWLHGLKAKNIYGELVN